MLGVALALLGWIAIGWLPGYLLLDRFRPSAGRARNAVFAPLVAAGLTTLVAEVAYVAGAGVRGYTVLPVSVGGPLLLWLAGRRSHGRAGRGTSILSSLDRTCLAAATALGVAIWCNAIRSTNAVLPYVDGSHHGLFAVRILRYATLDPRVVLSGDLATGTPHSAYYPLALHIMAALIAATTGVTVNLVLTVGLVLAAALLLPAGTLLLVRRICPALPAAAPVAALLSVGLAWFPYGPITWGGVPAIVAMCEVPIALDAMLHPPGRDRRLPSGLLMGLAAYGLFQQHNTELVTVALFGVFLAIPVLRRTGSDERRARLAVWGIGAAVLAVAVLPQTRQLVGGAQDASSLLGNKLGRAGGSVTPLTPGSAATVGRLIISPAVAIFSVIGIVAAIRLRTARGWGWCLVATVLLFFGTLQSIPVLSALTIPWYRATLRITYLFSYFEVTYAAIALVVIARGLYRALARHLSVTAATRAVAVCAALAGCAVAAAELPLSFGFARLAYRNSSLVGADERAAFHWLSSHVPAGGRVLNQFTDGSAWMETLDRVHPLFATLPDAGWGDRWYLLSHAADLATDPHARSVAAEWRVRYVYVDSRQFPGDLRRLMTAAALSSSPALRQVWQRGSVRIFEIRRAYE